jgi:hypothetical protein
MLRFQNTKSQLKKIVKRALAGHRGFRVRELSKAEVLLVPRGTEPRINLVVLGARKDGAFGGTETALRFFDSMRCHYKRSRVISLQESEDDHDARWEGRRLETDHSHDAHTVAYMGRRNFPLSVEHDTDHFIATHWLTADFVVFVRERQRASNFPAKNPFVYLIQDFEPGFYPWSSRYLLAESTYALSEDTIAVFNTDLLKKFFERAGHEFSHAYAFEPRLNPELAIQKRRALNHEKRKLMLIYGRPSSPRNAFELIVDTLHIFAERYKSVQKWDILSLGEPHGRVRLPGGVSIRSGGKLSLDQYAQHLLDASVGLSLMVSPHPSYPPLEMAEFGVRVVTNTFANKDLSARSKNILSVSDARPSSLADALIEACEAHEKGVPLSFESAFLGSEDEFSFSEQIAMYLRK